MDDQQINTINEIDVTIGTATVKEVHEKKLLHRAVHVFIINDKDQLLCRKRGLGKERYPGYWSTSLGAHVPVGETYRQTAERVVPEQLGIEPPLFFIGKSRIDDGIENEFSVLFLGYSTEDLEHKEIDKNEVEERKFFSVAEIKELVKTEKCTPHLKDAAALYEQSLQREEKEARRGRKADSDKDKEDGDDEDEDDGEELEEEE